MNRMVFLAFTLISVLIVSNINSSENKLSTNCSYEYSVDLTTVTPLKNGSYMYQQIEIPSKFVHEFPARLSENDSYIESTLKKEIRGCICSVMKCLYMCSSNFTDLYSNEVDTLYTKNITFNNGTIFKTHLRRDYYPIVKRPCDRNNLYPLSQEITTSDMWTLFENGTLLRHDDREYISQDKYCFDAYFPQEDSFPILVNPHNCGSDKLTESDIYNGYGILCSVPFFLATIGIIIVANRDLDVYKKCLISYLSALTISYLLLSYMILSTTQFTEIPCRILGFTIYYTTISYLIWTSIISHEIWKVNTKLTPASSFRRYSLIGWMLPLLMTILTALAQFCISNEFFTPGINDEACLFDTTRWSALIYMYIPSILVLIFSVYKYIRTLIHLNAVQKECAKYIVHKSNRVDFFRDFRVFLFMCLSWLLDTAAFFWGVTKTEKDSDSPIYITDILNGLQGIFMFFIYGSHFFKRNARWKRVSKDCSTSS
ncbi:G-protein coupled receptor Mth2-like [Haematobia irritans]|uniref:G-protein coupled receptor Mth2-like n=1 Tax=Haematobia irritans TaxID=7368 RepID=UPI003F4FD249